MCTLSPLPGIFARLGAIAAAIVWSLPGRAAAEAWIVKDGRPCAEIVVAEHPLRTVRLAAAELQAYLRRISGAEVPIVTNPTTGVTHLYVGKSAHTGERGVSDAGLEDGAFRMVSGPDWLALLGQDREYTATEPVPRSRSPEELDRVRAELDQLTGSTWLVPGSGTWAWNYNAALDIHAYDERGSLNAVYAFLRGLGVEWYMPGDLGELVPQHTTLALPVVDRLVRPDFGLRYFHGAAQRFMNREAVLWYLRLGLNHSSRQTGVADLLSHTMRNMHSRDEMKQAHPDYYALRAGVRATALNTPCLSSEGLFREHAKFVRFLFDHYDPPLVSLSPQDGAVYCDCPSCKAQQTPAQGWAGTGSDYVWGYADRLAREIQRTHPGKKVVQVSYANYVLPPEKIATLSSNMLVGLVQQRVRYHDPEMRRQDLERRQAWLKKMAPGNRFILWTHYPYTVKGRPSYGIPEYFPHRIAEDLRSWKGLSLGEFIEVQFEVDPALRGGIHAPGFNHLNLFVTARGYWNADQDVDALLDEYYTRFYGPARDGMKAFIEYCESHANRLDIGKQVATIDRVFELLGQAQAQASSNSIYGRRMALVAEYIRPLQDLRDQLARGRDDVPGCRIKAHEEAVAVRVDGNLDEDVWRTPGQGDLKDLITGAKPKQATSFRMLWAGNDLYLGIHCRDRDAANLNIATTNRDDQSIWDGDCVEILLETQNHCYYQIAVNPGGAVMDLDRPGGGAQTRGGFNTLWSAEAETAVTIGEDGWTVEMRLPVADTDLDPLRNVVGSKPTTLYPWYFNICRNRIRKDSRESTAFSPTGTRIFHNVSKFARLYTGVPEEAKKLRLQSPATAAQDTPRPGD